MSVDAVFRSIEASIAALPTFGFGGAVTIVIGIVILILIYAIGGALIGRDGDDLEDTLESAGDRTVEGFDALFTAGRVAAVATFSVVAMFGVEIAQFVAEIVAWLASAPVVVANLVTVGLGIASFRLGWIEVSFTAIAVVAIVLTAVGVGLRRSDEIRVSKR